MIPKEVVERMVAAKDVAYIAIEGFGDRAIIIEPEPRKNSYGWTVILPPWAIAEFRRLVPHSREARVQKGKKGEEGKGGRVWDN